MGHAALLDGADRLLHLAFVLAQVHGGVTLHDVQAVLPDLVQLQVLRQVRVETKVCGRRHEVRHHHVHSCHTCKKNLLLDRSNLGSLDFFFFFFLSKAVA